jgi:hypothetical protein
MFCRCKSLVHILIIDNELVPHLKMCFLNNAIEKTK